MSDEPFSKDPVVMNALHKVALCIVPSVFFSDREAMALAALKAMREVGDQRIRERRERVARLDDPKISVE